MNSFKTYHPIVNFLYFVFVTGFSMFFMHPVFLIISFVCSFSYSAILGNGKKNIRFLLPVILIMTFLNPLFNHEGATVIAYFSDGNPLTLESAIYGFFASLMLASVICWFSCYNEVMTSDKFIYLFGKIIPSLSLIISMILRFVPEFSHRLKTVTNAQKGIGRDISQGSALKRARNGLSILSVMITWGLESSVETADSMKSRGYGLSGRTAFSIYKFEKRDFNAIICILISALFVFCGNISGKISYSYFPKTEISFENIGIFAVYLFLCVIPIIIEITEVIRWKSIESKI